MQQTGPTMRDVAQLAGVALKTVSRVVNCEGGVSPRTREKVDRVVSEIGYTRNEMASNLRAGRSPSMIGLIIEDLANPFYSAVARGVEQVLGTRKLRLITASSEEDEERERELVTDLQQRRVGGLIIVPAAPDHRFIGLEIDKGLQVVFLDRPATGVDSDTVLLDNRGGSAAATEYLLARGHRRIAVIGHNAKVWTMQERLAGFASAIEESGGRVDESLIRLGPVTPADAAAATKELLEMDAPPTAFFACNNRMTVGVLTELRRQGVYHDIAGFDDIESAVLFQLPVALVAYDPVELGRTAARLLLERLSGRRTKEQLVINTRLVTYSGAKGASRRRSARSLGQPPQLGSTAEVPAS